MQNELRGLVNQLTYGIMFKDPVTDADVGSAVDAVLHQRGFGLPPDLYYRAAATNIDDDSLEDKERDFLSRFVEVMDARRPWPELPYIADLPTAINEMSTPRQVGTVSLSQDDIEERLGRSFQPVPGRSGEVLVLRVGSHVVAFESKASRSATGVSVLTTSNPDDVLPLVRERTGLPIE